MICNLIKREIISSRDRHRKGDKVKQEINNDEMDASGVAELTVNSCCLVDDNDDRHLLFCN